MLKPLFRWAGSKSKMKSKYGNNFMPSRTFDRFIDCFFGTGCVSMWMPHDVEIIANDFNSDIINIYRSIQKDPYRFCELVDYYQGSYIPLSYEERRGFYYEKRQEHAEDYDKIPDFERSVLLFFLLKTSFNGIWQINNNTKGKFGTPVGLANEVDKIYERQDVFDFADFSQRVVFLTGDFEVVKSYVTTNSFCFFDPPYRDCFTSYGSKTDVFTDDDQSRMCVLMNHADEVGSSVAMSNKYHGDNFFETRLSVNFKPMIYDVTYTAGRGAKNGTKVKAKECLFRNYNNSSLTNFFA
jgi:DNA adenine methylase